MIGKGKIEKSGNLAHADRILREVRKIWPKAWEGWLKVWSNGREQGYYLQATKWLKNGHGRAACVFSEGRSCDGALVIVGPANKFDYQTNHPRTELWHDENCREYFYDTTGLKGPDGREPLWNKKYKGRGDKLAAKWIIKRLREIIAEDVKVIRANIKAQKPMKVEEVR